MTEHSTRDLCPDCDDPLVFAYRDTSGVGAHKRGDNFNTTPDTDHFLCLLCTKAWKRRLDGPLTPDVVGDLAFFTCRNVECGRPMEVVALVDAGPGTELACASGHRVVIRAADDGSLMVEDA